MLIKRIKTKTRPSIDTSINYNWNSNYDDLELQNNNFYSSSLENGLIYSVVNFLNESELTLTEERHFTSIQNCIDFEKQLYDVEYNNGSLAISLQYMLDNNITHTVSYVFEN